MAATGYTPIQPYYSTTASTVPLAANMVTGELALNTYDGKLYFKNSSGVVTLLASTATSTAVTSISFGSTGLTPSTATTGVVTVAGTLVAVNGGTGQSSYATGDLLYASSTTALSRLAAGTSGQILTSSGAGAPTWTTVTGTGTVTTLSVVSANGFTGTVANPTTTPAITLTTSINGILKGNGTAISAATAGTDYAVPSTASTWTATQTFNGSTSSAAIKLTNATELMSIVASAPSATQVFYIHSGATQYYTVSAANNWTVNFAFSSGTSMNTAMAVGDSISTTMLTTQGSTAYYNSAVQVDGTTTGVTTKWQGGTVPSSGNASSVDSYTYVIIKTAASTYTVLASQTKFA